MLIGYRGTGKSVVGEALGKHLDWPVVSTDAEIVRRAGCSIPEIVAQHGWERFREIEEEVVKDLAKSRGAVIDCGGGVVTRPVNIERLKANGKVVWLRAPVAVIAQRIAGDGERPPLTGGSDSVAEIAAVLREREPLYQAAADLEVESLADSPERLAKYIADSLEIP